MEKRRIKGSLISTIGFLLSPLSWWNDLFVNLPLAYIIAFLFSLISKGLFMPMMIIGYWFTNILGLMLLHYGISTTFSDEKKKFSKKDLFISILISVLYTILMVLLIKIGLLRFPLEYFRK